MFQRILVPVDLTEKSVAAVDLAHEFALHFKCEVILLHVIEVISHVPFDELKDFYERLEHSAHRGMKEISESFVSNHLPITQAVIYGGRSERIIEFAVENQADLIILASHRINPDRPGHDFSSISYSVAILAPCPVLLAK
jgi:nucleotide-binding universal stress UspA family protein